MPVWKNKPRLTPRFWSLTWKSIKMKYVDEQSAMVGNSKCNIENQIQQQCTRPSIHPLASKVLFSFHDFRIGQSINLCCCITNVNISYCLGAKKNESMDCLIMADYRVLSWSWRSGPRYDWCLCLTKDDHENLSIFIAAKNQGSWLQYCTVCPLCSVSNIRQNLVVGEISKSISVALRDESTVRGIVHFLQSTIYADFHSIACLKDAKTAQTVEKDTTGRRGVVCMN